MGRASFQTWVRQQAYEKSTKMLGLHLRRRKWRDVCLFLLAIFSGIFGFFQYWSCNLPSASNENPSTYRDPLDRLPLEERNNDRADLLFGVMSVVSSCRFLRTPRALSPYTWLRTRTKYLTHSGTLLSHATDADLRSSRPKLDLLLMPVSTHIVTGSQLYQGFCLRL